ncbi:MAG TPA: Arm DNA-binding domain-containing protein [Frankiaceae bacterium]|nr:Arm DNA-binding domain-containing protein [Frankiaceae bacterium]
MRGSIVKRGEMFHAVLDLPRGEDGKRRQKWLSGYATRREAEAALAHALNEVHTGRHVEPITMTVRHFLCDEWLPASAARVRATTLRGYRPLINSYAVPALGDVRLVDVTPVVLTKLYGRLLTSGRANGKGGLSARTVASFTPSCVARSPTPCAGATSRRTPPTARRRRPLPRHARRRCARDAVTSSRHPPKDRRQRAAWPLDGGVHPGHLQPRGAVAAGRGRTDVRSVGVRLIVHSQCPRRIVQCERLLRMLDCGALKAPPHVDHLWRQVIIAFRTIT